MGRDDLFRRSVEAGTAFFDMTRERAESIVKDLVKAGEVQKGKAQKVIDELLERSRKGTEELRELVKREIAEQISALGLATKDDIRRLEDRLDQMAAPSGGAAAGAPGAAPPPSPQATKAAGVKKSRESEKSPAAKAATKTPPAGKAAPGRKTGKAAEASKPSKAGPSKAATPGTPRTPGTPSASPPPGAGAPGRTAPADEG